MEGEMSSSSHEAQTANASSGLAMHGAISGNYTPLAAATATVAQESSTNSWEHLVHSMSGTGTNGSTHQSSESVSTVTTSPQTDATGPHQHAAVTTVATAQNLEAQPTPAHAPGEQESPANRESTNEQTEGGAAGSVPSKPFSAKRTLETGEEVAPFVSKLKTALDDPDTDHIIRWREDGGTGFEILRPADLASQVLPRMFRAANSTEAFTRQLKGYGFQYLGSPQKRLPQSRAFEANDFSIYYENENFYKDMPPRLLSFVRPRSALKKMKSTSGSRSESVTTKTEATEENGNASRSEVFPPSNSRTTIDKETVISSKEAAVSAPPSESLNWPSNTEVTPDQAKVVCKSMEQMAGLPLALCAAAYFEENGVRNTFSKLRSSFDTADIEAIENYVLGDSSNSFPKNCYRILLEATVNKGNARESLGLHIVETPKAHGGSKCYFVGGVAQNTIAAACRPELLTIEFPRGNESMSSGELGSGVEFVGEHKHSGVRIPRRELRIQPGDRIMSVAGWSVEDAHSDNNNPIDNNAIKLLQAPMCTPIRVVLERWSTLCSE
eukprot:gb/GECG01002921.1/.p1 GENE.gb/GECG01002921.1/~~gb/GECG01002921.1/.p1  ORF type:complete len:554 (+),score=69.81 gb/GECG01002921.1/:1-1662(+)